jgi:hypothetical protein
VIREMVEKAEQARDALGERLGRPIPTPLDQWEVEGISCALFEELTPISRNRVRRFLQLRKTTPQVLEWLRQIADLNRGANVGAQACVKALAGCPFEPLRAAAAKAFARISAGTFVVRSAVMHGDLWIGNVLLDSSGARDFMVIDWRGSNIDGFPIFDLVKFAESVRMPARALRAELAAHAERLGCSLEDTYIYLVAALGYIWRNLDQFPPERFAEMAAGNLATMKAALNV